MYVCESHRQRLRTRERERERGTDRTTQRSTNMLLGDAVFIVLCLHENKTLREKGRKQKELGDSGRKIKRRLGDGEMKRRMTRRERERERGERRKKQRQIKAAAAESVLHFDMDV